LRRDGIFAVSRPALKTDSNAVALSAQTKSDALRYGRSPASRPDPAPPVMA